MDPASLTVAALEDRFAAEVWPVMTRQGGDCRGCHLDNANFKMTLHGDASSSWSTLLAAGYLGSGANTILDRVSRAGAGAMPLTGQRWSPAEVGVLQCLVDDIEAWERAGGDPHQGGCEDIDPGRVTLHRLNRAEYNNTVRDLLGDDTHPADAFPDDDRSLGFDNIADVLTLSSLHIEKYDAAAELLIENALGARPEAQAWYFEAEAVGSDVGSEIQYAWNLSVNGGMTQEIELPWEGDYEVSVRAWGEQAGEEPAQMLLRVDGVPRITFDVEAVEDSPAIYTYTARLEPGAHQLEISFTNDYFKPLAPRGERDRNLIIDWFEVTGPHRAAPEPTEMRPSIITCDPTLMGDEPCARQILRGFGLRAWRRPPEAAELDRLWGLVALVLEEEGDFEGGIRLAMNAALLSPNFLFRVELDPDPTSTTDHPLTDFELASRLSYFLWSSTPDATLLDLAAEGRLNDPEVLEAQVARLLADPRSAALVDNFAGQWLYIRAVHEAVPDPELFPDFDDSLRLAMAEEMRLFFEAFLYEDRPIPELLDADFTFLNDRLAQHYGMDPPGSEAMVPVSLEGGERGGLLTFGGLLTVTSHPDGTSPVRRGKWVLEQLLCDAPPPPPAGVEGLDEQDLPEDASKRERMELHRADPVCASCHATMDPIGFALENYSPVSQWRELDDFGQPIDATGVLPDGRTFDGARELAQVIKEDPNLGRCVAEQLFTYALGRGVEPADDCALTAAVERAEEGGLGIQALVRALTVSEPFTARRGEPDPTPIPDDGGEL